MTGIVVGIVVALVVVFAMLLNLIAFDIALFLALRSGIPQGPFPNRAAEQTLRHRTGEGGEGDNR
jgi:hypothetical protein